MIRSGRGGNCGAIAGLGSAVDIAGASWLLAAVERGRPRLIDPERLGVVALLGRRREWRAAADERSPFLPVVCDRAPVSVAGRQFVLSRSPRGGLDLVSVRPGEPLERWWLGEQPRRVELLAGDGLLGFWAGGRVAIVEVAELVPGGCPLLDPRDVELRLRWLALPSSVIAVCDLLDQAVRVIERRGEGWALAELELGDERASERGAGGGGWPAGAGGRGAARAGGRGGAGRRARGGPGGRAGEGGGRRAGDRAPGARGGQPAAGPGGGGRRAAHRRCGGHPLAD